MFASSSGGSKGGNWTGYLHFWNGNRWTKHSAGQLIRFFENELHGEQEIIEFTEICKYSLTGVTLVPVLGFWHEYTILRTTNWWWSFEKMREGIYVQRSSNMDDVKKYFGNEKRLKNHGEGRHSDVSYRENVVDVANWIINRNELDNTYHLTERNCQVFASLLYEAITRTVSGRRLRTNS